jgi:hypothetical protein
MMKLGKMGRENAKLLEIFLFYQKIKNVKTKWQTIGDTLSSSAPPRAVINRSSS